MSTTPGPWKIEETPLGKAEEWYCGFIYVGPAVIGFNADKGPTAQDRADARLIAAAPTLRLALEDLISHQGWGTANALERAQAVLDSLSELSE